MQSMDLLKMYSSSYIEEKKNGIISYMWWYVVDGLIDIYQKLL